MASSATETVKPRGNVPCVRCGHGRRSHLRGVGDCFGKTDDVPCTCLKYLPPAS